MATLVWLEGFEHQNVSNSGWSYVPNVWDTIGADSANISFPAGRTAGVCVRFTFATSGTGRLSKARTYDAGAQSIWSGTMMVGSFYFRIVSGLSSGSHWLFYFLGDNSQETGWRFDSSGIISFRDNTVTRSSSAGSFADGNWHRLDFKEDIGGGTCTWAIDGTTIGASDTVQTTTNFDTFNVGSSLGGQGSTTYEIDDLVLSTTSGDYPLGEHKVLLLSPNADGTHNVGSSGLAKSTGGTTDVWDVIDEIPMTITDYLLQATADTIRYLEWHYPDSTEASLNGARAILCTASAGTAANSAQAGVYTSSGGQIAVMSGDFSATTAQHNAIMFNWSGQGLAMTIANLNACKGQFGRAGDATPDPWLGGAAIEYAVPVAAATGKAPPFRRQYPRAMIVR